MAEKNSSNSNESEKENIEQANTKTSKSCPKCGKVYQDGKEVTFCYYDGAKLVIGEYTVQSSVQSPPQIKNPLDYIGFEISLQNSNNVANIPLELIQSTTRLLQPNPKLPIIAENVKTSFLSIPSPKLKRNFLTRRIKHSGFSRGNLFAYFYCLLFVGITYGMWMIRAIRHYDIDYTSNLTYLVGISLIINFFLLIVLILPIIMLGYAATDTIQASKDDFQLKIEPSLFIFSIILNFMIFSFMWPLPIIVIPGEPKIRGVPPLNTVSRAIKNGILPGFFLVLSAFTLLTLTNQNIIQMDIFLKMNLEIFVLFGLSIFFLELMPFKNAIGKLIQKHSPTTFYVIFMAVFMLLISTLSMVEF